MAREYYRINWASPRKHEHWYAIDGEDIIGMTCILNDPGARCVAPHGNTADDIRRGRYSQKVPSSRVPKYALRRLEDARDEHWRMTR